MVDVSKDSERLFWDVRHPENAVVVDLDHEDYDALIIEVEDPEATIDLLSGPPQARGTPVTLAS
jgi:hypothetical protein